MSNYLAVGTVTAALQLHLTDAVKAAVAGADVWVDRPDVKRQKPGVNIYLYRTSYDPAWRNHDLPARRADGSLAQRPTVAASLHYLLTFHGKDDELAPQRLLGAALAALHSRPLITRDLVDRVVAEAADNPPSHPYLATSDLADADEIVRITPDPLDLEQLSKLWSVLFQTPYQLSATYLASAVLLEEQQGTPITAPPVLRSQLDVRTLAKPRINTAHATGNPLAPVVSDTELQINGSGLRGVLTTVRVGGTELTPAAEHTTATSVRVGLAAIPAGRLRPGLQPLVVAHGWLVGSPPEPRAGELSNAVGVLVSPRINASADDGRLTVTSDLVIGARQQATIALLVPATGATARLLDVADRPSDTATLSVSLLGVAAGTYGVSLYVDGAQSPVTRDATGTITSPLVLVP